MCMIVMLGALRTRLGEGGGGGFFDQWCFFSFFIF